MNSAPSVPYVMLVPDSAENSELSPAVKSTMTVLPRALSLGQAEKVSKYSQCRVNRSFLTCVCQRVTICRSLPLNELGESKA